MYSRVCWKSSNDENKSMHFLHFYAYIITYYYKESSINHKHHLWCTWLALFSSLGSLIPRDVLILVRFAYFMMTNFLQLKITDIDILIRLSKLGYIIICIWRKPKTCFCFDIWKIRHSVRIKNWNSWYKFVEHSLPFMIISGVILPFILWSSIIFHSYLAVFDALFDIVQLIAQQ